MLLHASLYILVFTTVVGTISFAVFLGKEDFELGIFVVVGWGILTLIAILILGLLATGTTRYELHQNADGSRTWQIVATDAKEGK